MFDGDLKKLAKLLKERHLTISTAESCTGGLVASMLTDISGSSEYLLESHVVYANSAKHKYLNVSNEILDTLGAVSPECAQAMAEGLQKLANCDVALCTTGIAGPTGGTKDKPVGLVYISARFNGKTTVRKYTFNSRIPRKTMKTTFAKAAIRTALEALEG